MREKERELGIIYMPKLPRDSILLQSILNHTGGSSELVTWPLMGIGWSVDKVQNSRQTLYHILAFNGRDFFCFFVLTNSSNGDFFFVFLY